MLQAKTASEQSADKTSTHDDTSGPSMQETMDSQTARQPFLHIRTRLIFQALLIYCLKARGGSLTPPQIAPIRFGNEFFGQLRVTDPFGRALSPLFLFVHMSSTR